MAQSSHGSSRHRRSERDGSSSRYTHNEWEAKEALYQRELDEARARATQMEKTMRWWSDCTANWREKWTKVRNERNKARDEAKQYKTKLETLTKELNNAKAESHDLEQQLRDIKQDNDKLLSISESKIVSCDITAEGVELRRKNTSVVSPNDSQSFRQRASLDSHKFSNVDHCLANKLSEMRLRYEDTCKTLQNEKDQKAFLMNKIENLTAQLLNAKTELSQSDRTLGSTDSSHSQIERLQNELQDEIAAKQVLEEKIAELKMEVEHLKTENNIQWSKREMLETENVAILRENKKLYGQVCELREQIHKLNRISDTSHYGIPFVHNKLDANALYVRKTSASPRSHENSSNGSSDGNLAQSDVKTNTSGDDDCKLDNS